MPIKKIKKCLESYDKGRPINRLLFEESINKLHLKQHYNVRDCIEYFQPNKNNPRQFIVTNINQELLAELRSHVENIGADRQSASLHGKSHSFKVDGSMLVCRVLGSHPFIVKFDKDQRFTSPQKLNKNILIVENLQLFLHDLATFKLLVDYCQFKVDDFKDLDIVWGDGNCISNSLHYKFLSQYDNVFCLFDVDLGGVTIARNLISSGIDIKLILPASLEQRLQLVPTFQSNDVIQEVIRVCGNEPALMPVASIIKKTHKFIEQEDYLQWIL